jgi:hypothetical protein
MSQPYLDHVVTVFHNHHLQLFVANLSTRALQPNSPYQDHAYHLDSRVAAWAQAKDVPFLSLLPVITQAYKEKPISEILIEGDGHPTPATHTLIEAALKPWLLPLLSSSN